MNYSYFPGCTLKTRGAQLDKAGRLAAEKLGFSFVQAHAPSCALRGEGMECEARVCERHTGTGLTAQQIAEQGLPLPAIDLLPETEEEQVICYADKFYSKSHPERERTVEQTAESLKKFGEAGVLKFLAWAKKYE